MFYIKMAFRAQLLPRVEYKEISIEYRSIVIELIQRAAHLFIFKLPVQQMLCRLSGLIPKGLSIIALSLSPLEEIRVNIA